MQKKRTSGGSAWVDPDDAPELTDEFFDKAEVFHGDTFIQRGPGRPKLATAKEQISVRLDPDVLAKLREAGPGWQSQINALLRQALGVDREKTKSAQVAQEFRRVYVTAGDTTNRSTKVEPPFTRKKSAGRGSRQKVV